MADQPRELFFQALDSGGLGAVSALLRDHPDLIEAAGERWASGLYTRRVASGIGRLLAELGAPLTVHAAAGLGLVDRLADLLTADPSLIDAKGCDGCTPLHFARDVGIAKLLLDHGARVDARDDDHDSTPAQWLIGDAPEVSRFLFEHGATPDIFLAAALGDRGLAEKLMDLDPACLSQRIGRAPEFPPIGHNHRGGTIYQWTLAFNSYPHQIALRKGHDALFDFMYEKSDTPTRLLVSCLLARRIEAEAIAAAHPKLVASLPPEDHKLVAQYCWETNTNYEAVKLMLDVGFPVAHPETAHGYSPLHNAAWAGSAELVNLLIERGHPLDLVDPRFHSTPLGFAIYDCTVEKRHPEGEFGRVVKSLIGAGSPWDALSYPTGDARIDDVMKPRLQDRVDGAALLGDDAAVTRLLGASPSQDALSEALSGAAKGGHAGLSHRLLKAGAPVNTALGDQAMTPLMRAAMSASHETIALLMEHGADIQAKNANGTTAFHMAVWYGASLKTIELLLRSGAKPLIEAENDYGYTPLSIAIEKGCEEIVQLLRESTHKA